MTDPMKPHSTLLAKLGNIAHHALLLTGNVTDDNDVERIGKLGQYRRDPEVLQWLSRMEQINLLPKEA